MTREERRLKKHLRELCAVVIQFQTGMDRAMAGPAGRERGEYIANLSNQLDIQADIAMRYGLGMSFAAIRKARAL